MRVQAGDGYTAAGRQDGKLLGIRHQLIPCCLEPMGGVVNTLLQTEKYGTPLAKALRVLKSRLLEMEQEKAESAMTEERPYRSAKSPDAALGEIRKGAGRQFDPRVVEVLEKVV